MRRFNQILGFLAVSFVLVFISKVNKVGLFSAYIKTIAEVEIRNSHQIKSSDAALLAPLVEVSSKSAQGFSSALLAACLSEGFESLHFPHTPSKTLPTKEVLAPRKSVFLMSGHAPRAPGLA